MSNSVEMKLEGIDELLKKTEELGRKGSTIENDALRRASEVVIKEMKATAPTRTKRLRDDIGVLGGISNKKGIKTIKIGATTSRSSKVLHFQETGTSKMDANPFFSRAFENKKGLAQQIMIQQIKIGLGI